MRFHRGLFGLICSLILLVTLVGCDFGGGDDGDSNSGGGYGTATIQGNVVDVSTINNANPTMINNAQLSTGDVTTTSAAGAFTLANVAIPSDGIVKITISRNGSLSTYAFEPVSNGQTLVATYALKIIPAGSINNLNMAAAATAQDNGRPDSKIAKVEFAAHSILDASGNPVNSANVTVVNQVPGDAGYADTFPGVFAGVRTDNSTTPFESYGFVNVDLGANKLDPTKPATLKIPVAVGNTPTDATIPLWSFDPSIGQWKEEGVATRTVVGADVFYVGQVTHFSFYNLDSPFAGGNFVVNVASGSLVVSGAKITMTSTWSDDNKRGVWKDIKYSDATGKASFSVPAGRLDIKVEKDGKTANGYGYDRTGTNASATIDINGFHHEPWNQ